jgi:hypothetical protein
MAHGNRSPSPSVAPLTYPGVLPDGPVVLQEGRFVDVDLRDLDLTGRHPLLAVGSNAGRARLVEKLDVLAGPQLVPVIPCEVEGMAVAFTPLVASYGSIPYTAVPGAGLRCHTFLQYLDDDQLAVVDASEQPAYRRDLLTALRVTLPTGEVLTEAWAYVCERGAIRGDDGSLLPVGGQAEVLGLLARWFPDLLPGDPLAAVELLRSEPRRRRAIADALHAAGRVHPTTAPI